MDKKKKIIIISISAVIALIIIGVTIYFITRNVTESANENKLLKMYEKMAQNETYTISFKLNDDNQYTVSRQGNQANIDIYDEGTRTTDIIKDGNTYLLVYSTNRYYTYNNNDLQLTELINEINDIIQSQEPEKGEEEINGKTYEYLEYKNVSYFLMNPDETVSGGNTSQEDENINTRFYFKGDKLEYIKTIMPNKTELLEVNVSYDVDNSLFEIPDNFEGEQ